MTATLFNMEYEDRSRKNLNIITFFNTRSLYVVNNMQEILPDCFSAIHTIQKKFLHTEKLHRTDTTRHKLSV